MYAYIFFIKDAIFRFPPFLIVKLYYLDLVMIKVF